jgi:hypothetical protein
MAGRMRGRKRGIHRRWAGEEKGFSGEGRGPARGLPGPRDS